MVTLIPRDHKFLLTNGIFNKLERSEEHTSELQSQFHLVCRLLLEKKNQAVCRRSSSPRCVSPSRTTACLPCSSSPCSPPSTTEAMSSTERTHWLSCVSTSHSSRFC